MKALETVSATCPYCGQSIVLQVDCGEIGQRYVEDCPVCCRPMDVVIGEAADEGVPSVVLGRQEGV